MDYSHCVRYGLREPSPPPALQNHFANGMHRMGPELLEKRKKVISWGAADNPFYQHRPERAPTYAIKSTGDTLIHNPIFICDCLHQEIACIIRPDLE